MNLEDRPLVRFNAGERVRLVDERGVNGFKKRHGIREGEIYQVKRCWCKNSRRKNMKILLTLEGYGDWIFSARRFERLSYLPEDLFKI